MRSKRRHPAKATDRQIRYIMILLGKAGFDTKWMDSQYKKLGATMRERSGLVENWVQSLDIARASKFIEQLIEIVEHSGKNNKQNTLSGDADDNCERSQYLGAS